MKRRIWNLVTAPLLLVIAAEGTRLAAQQPTTVQLPPIMVEDTAKLPAWLYARTSEGEFLSRCSERVTRGYVETREGRRQLLHWLVPREFFVRMDVPAVTILYSQRLKNSAAEELMAEVMRSRSREGRGGRAANSVTTAVPNMLLEDDDIIGVFAYVDEKEFDRNRLSLATDYVRLMLERRVPALPRWLLEGIAGLYAEADFVESPITLPPLTWLSKEESSRLAGTPERPRMLLPAAEFFAEATWREEAERSLRGQTLAAQSRLLVRWAVDPAQGVREAFWRFAARAGEEPVTEAMFESCFGFGFSDLRDRLSDYLSEAVRKPLRLEAIGQRKLPPAEVRPATPTEVARLRGEWERLAIGFVQRRFPEVADRYVEQARRTLRRAYDSGDRDARLFAAWGLCEVEAGNAAAGREYLERAVAEGVVRPRAYYELARLRWAEATRGEERRTEEAQRRWSANEIELVVGLVRAGVKQAPALSGNYGLLAEAWARSGDRPPEGDVKLLVEGGRLFMRESRLVVRIARTLARHGLRDEAIKLLGEGFVHAHGDATRREFAEVYAALKGEDRAAR